MAKPKLAPWNIEFFARHPDDDPDETVPAQEFLDACPPKVRAMFVAVVQAVAAAPPPAFSGGGKWEAMHGAMGGYYEIRVDGPKRTHYRLFCLLERDGASVGLDGSSLILIAGMEKRFLTTFTSKEYESIRDLGKEYKARNPRSVVE